MYYMTDDFTVVKRKEDGTIAEHRFSSHAQARQFMEKNAGQAPPAPVKRALGNQARRKRNLFPTPIEPKTPEQRQAKAEALKMFKNL